MVEDSPISDELIDKLQEHVDTIEDKLIQKTRISQTDYFQLIQQQYLVDKIKKQKEKQEKRTVLEEEEMFRTCQMGYDGMNEYREDAIDKFTNLMDGLTLRKYKELLAPLGNYILGYKTLKQFCTDYLQPNQMETADKYYDEIKERINDIDEETDRHIEDKYTVSIQRDYGVTPQARAGQQETIWNIDGQPLKDIEHFEIIDAIAKYEKKTGKNAIWRGAKTRPFMTFLRKWEREHGIESKKPKKIIEI